MTDERDETDEEQDGDEERKDKDPDSDDKDGDEERKDKDPDSDDKDGDDESKDEEQDSDDKDGDDESKDEEQDSDDKDGDDEQKDEEQDSDDKDGDDEQKAGGADDEADEEEEEAEDDERGESRRAAVTGTTGRAATSRATVAVEPFPRARSFANPLRPADKDDQDKLADAMTELKRNTRADLKFDNTTVVIADAKTGKFVGFKERDTRFPSSVGKLCAIYGLFALRDTLDTYAKRAAGTLSQAEFFASVLKRSEQRVADDSPLRDTVFASLDKTSASNLLGSMYDSSYTYGDLGDYFELIPPGGAGSQRIRFTSDVEDLISSFGDDNSGSRANLAASATGYAYIAHALVRAGLMDLKPLGGLWFATVYGAGQADGRAPPAWKVQHIAAPGGRSNQATALHLAQLWTLVAQQAFKDDAGVSARSLDPTHPIRSMRLSGLTNSWVFRGSPVRLGKVGDVALDDGYATFSEVTWVKIGERECIVCYLDVRASGLGPATGGVFWTNYIQRIVPFRDMIVGLVRDGIVD